MAGVNLMGRVGGNFSDMDEEHSAESQNGMGDDDPEESMKAYEHVKAEIQKIDENAARADNVIVLVTKAASSEKEKDAMKQLNKIIADNKKVVESVKSELKNLKLANDKAKVKKGGSSLAQIRENEWNSCSRKFQNASTKFQTALSRFNNELKSRQKRLLGAVDQNLSSEQIDELVNSPDKADAYLKEVFAMQVGDAMVDRLAEIEARTKGMQNIYESLEELRVMWNELNFLTSEQQEMIDSIDNNVQRTNEYVHQATANLEKAEEHQKKSRKCQFILLCICLVVLIVVIFGGMGAAGVFKHA